jgi:hypothetical protein
LITNPTNINRGIDNVIKELLRLKTAIARNNQKQLKTLLEQACTRRAELINYKMKKKEIIP